MSLQPSSAIGQESRIAGRPPVHAPSRGLPRRMLFLGLLLSVFLFLSTCSPWAHQAEVIAKLCHSTADGERTN